MELRVSAEGLHAKAVRWMGALQRQTRAVWTAQGEDPEAVAIECSLAATAVRVLDLEVFQRAHGSAYEQLRASHSAGRVIDGMTLVRNAEMHLPVVLTPASNMAANQHRIMLGGRPFFCVGRVGGSVG